MSERWNAHTPPYAAEVAVRRPGAQFMTSRSGVGRGILQDQVDQETLAIGGRDVFRVRATVHDVSDVHGEERRAGAESNRPVGANLDGDRDQLSGVGHEIEQLAAIRPPPALARRR